MAPCLDDSVEEKTCSKVVIKLHFNEHLLYNVDCPAKVKPTTTHCAISVSAFGIGTSSLIEFNTMKRGKVPRDNMKTSFRLVARGASRSTKVCNSSRASTELNPEWHNAEHDLQTPNSYIRQFTLIIIIIAPRLRTVPIRQYPLRAVTTVDTWAVWSKQTWDLITNAPYLELNHEESHSLNYIRFYVQTGKEVQRLILNQ